ncbi:hypothetical protein [Pseudovibrio exalbescens]|uniref:Uncharacterized protein n=1 Tax=Pseudovibrio exalbescens TaxID=197461 RepID=A0A1U7JEI3_9HYPH|nr:hypothetical protein [Pseudovibrio exalbescens]OKL43094.1 hypothetical protein A3843_15305 [Pseudovibrio exalbescens]
MITVLGEETDVGTALAVDHGEDGAMPEQDMVAAYHKTVADGSSEVLELADLQVSLIGYLCQIRDLLNEAGAPGVDRGKVQAEISILQEKVSCCANQLAFKQERCKRQDFVARSDVEYLAVPIDVMTAADGSAVVTKALLNLSRVVLITGNGAGALEQPVCRPDANLEPAPTVLTMDLLDLTQGVEGEARLFEVLSAVEGLERRLQDARGTLAAFLNRLDAHQSALGQKVEAMRDHLLEKVNESLSLRAALQLAGLTAEHLASSSQGIAEGRLSDFQAITPLGRSGDGPRSPISIP